MGIPFERIGSTPRRAQETERDRAAIVLASFLQGLLDFCPDYFHDDIRRPLAERIDAVRASQGLPQAPIKSRSPSNVSEAKAHLGAALIQTTTSDDQIIIDHVRKAHALLGGRL